MYWFELQEQLDVNFFIVLDSNLSNFLKQEQISLENILLKEVSDILYHQFPQSFLIAFSWLN